jgi:hypothetical protein
MARSFSRQLTFVVEGEIYDNETIAEDIIKNYDWHDMTSNYENSIHLMADHNDNRGKITKMYRVSKIEKVPKHPDTEYFMV